MGSTRRHTVLALLLTGAMVAGACASDDDDARREGGGGPSVPWPEARQATLAVADSCDDLTDQIHQHALAQTENGGMGPQANGIPVMSGGRADIAVDAMVGADMMMEASDASGDLASPVPAAPVVDTDGTFSDTNVQEAGVDEPDVVKTDGRRLVSAVDGVLRVVDLTTPVPVEVGSVDLDGDWGHSLFLDDDRVVVLAGRQLPLDIGPQGSSDMDVGWGASGTQVSVYDLSEPDDAAGAGDPAFVTSYVLEGDLVAARRIDGQVRIVTTANSQPFSASMVDLDAFGEDPEQAVDSMIRATAATDWLPTVRTVSDSGIFGEPEALVACDQIGVPVAFSGFGSVVVSTLHTDDARLDADASVGVMATDATVYASPQNLYVATSEWVESDDDQPWAGASATGIHRFGLAGDGPASYVASGQVEGRLLNQFAMSEHDGHLRVATTTDGAMDFGMPVPIDDVFIGDELFDDVIIGEGLIEDVGLSDNVEHVMATDGPDLVTVGEVAGMGLGERIYSVRYLGDMGYVVTFRETDPLYTIDLSDPTDPRVLGELKIPGFSTYLHPTEPGRLVGVGQDATETGLVTGLQVSLFDVSDPTDPRRTQQWTLPDASSMAEHQHLAFLWWGPEQTLALPVSEWQTGFEGIVVLQVTDAGIVERGRIRHQPDQETPTPCDVVGCPGVDDPESTTTTAPTSTTTSTTQPDATTTVPVTATTEPALTTTTAPTDVTTSTSTTVDPGTQADRAAPGTSERRPPEVDTDGAGDMLFEHGEVLSDDIAEPMDPTEPFGPVMIEPGPGAPSWSGSVTIERTIVVGDTLITVSRAGVKVSALDDLTTRAWIPFG